MDYPTLVATARENGGYPDRQSAEEMLTTVLGLLGHRLGSGAASNVAGQLPAEAGEALTADCDDTPPSWGVSEFISQLAQATGATEQEASTHAEAVLGALANTVSGGELNAILTRLPAGYARLFQHPELA